jgi:indolepyruvate ferredoxin oxidoreductase beta subunit
MSPKRKPVVNVVIAGVGGQGSILAAHLLAQTALKEGLDVKLAETFGAATRGGSVMAHVRIGQVWAPTMRADEADVVLSMEPLEGLRVAVQFLKPGGWALINTRPVLPVDVAVGRVEYPPLDGIVDGLCKLGASVVSLDATGLAIEAGNARAANTVLLGGLFALSLLHLSEDNLLAAMHARWNERLVALNQRAYKLGHDAVSSSWHLTESRAQPPL